MNSHYYSATSPSFKNHHSKIEHLNDTDPMIDSKWTINAKQDHSDLSQVFCPANILRSWLDIPKVNRWNVDSCIKSKVYLFFISNLVLFSGILKDWINLVSKDLKKFWQASDTNFEKYWIASFSSIVIPFTIGWTLPKPK